MSHHHHVFFPTPLPTAPLPATATATAPPRATFLYGWTHGTATVVAGALDALSWADATARVERVATAFSDSDGPSCVVVEVLGRLTRGGDSSSATNCSSSREKERGTALDVRLSPAGVPVPLPHTTTILYTPPSRANLQFFSLEPLQLDLNQFSDPAPKDPKGDADVEGTVLGDKVRQSARLDFSRRECGPGTDLARVVDCLNVAPYLTSAIASLSPPRRPSLPSLSRFLGPPLAVLRPPLQFLHLLAWGLVLVANWEIPGLGGTAPKDLSATIQQVDTRLSQGLSWPSQFRLIRQTLDTVSPASEAHSLAAGRAHYIQFYNTLWLIANDVIVGSALTSFLCENSEFLGNALGTLIQEYTLTSLRELLLWLNDWPGGVKLNFELASVFCDAFLWGTGIWEDLIFAPLRASLPALVYAVGLSGLLGTTMLLSVASDLLALLTLHVFVFYLLIASLFRWHLSMLSALFNIFRGKKYNVLRHRVEPASYTVDQLLLGTILFTLAAFLFPTVLAYYLAFASARLALVAVHAAGESVLAFMNHFPLFAVMLRFKDPKRLPGGLRFQVSDEGGGGLRMENNPIHLAGIFFQHLQLSRRLASHYSPLYLLGRLLTGRLISPIPRVRLRLSVDVNPLGRRTKVD